MESVNRTNRNEWLRTIVQVFFLAFVIFIGFRFSGFVVSLSNASANLALRPPSVEGFLPISSLMSLTYFIKTGIANTVHPSGFVIFTLTLVLSVLFRRGFCGWICPVGTISEFAQKLGRRIFGSNLKMPKWLNLPLLSLKYILMAFFVFIIVPLPASGLRSFIEGPYSRIVDVKMYLFFANISRGALSAVLILFLLSVFVRHFWCRYLCPYGALLGLLSLVSPSATRRNEEKCIHCGNCTKSCPNDIEVEKKHRVNSAECMACFSCVDACPSEGAIQFDVAPMRFRLSKLVYAAITVLVILAVTQIASMSGYWQTDTSPNQYRELYTNINLISH